MGRRAGFVRRRPGELVAERERCRGAERSVSAVQPHLSTLQLCEARKVSRAPDAHGEQRECNGEEQERTVRTE